MKRSIVICIALAVLTAVLFAVNLAVGSVSIPLRDVISIVMGHEAARPSWQYIVMESRLPQAITAMLCGASLAISGLMLQTAFKNPLAGPSIFGINSGAGMGVALVMLGLGGSLSIGSVSMSGFMAVLAAAFAGAMAVMALIFLFSTMVCTPQTDSHILFTQYPRTILFSATRQTAQCLVIGRTICRKFRC